MGAYNWVLDTRLELLTLCYAELWWWKIWWIVFVELHIIEIRWCIISLIDQNCRYYASRSIQRERTQAPGLRGSIQCKDKDVVMVHECRQEGLLVAPIRLD